MVSNAIPGSRNAAEKVERFIQNIVKLQQLDSMLIIQTFKKPYLDSNTHLSYPKLLAAPNVIRHKLKKIGN